MITAPVRIALIAVKNGAVKIDERGCRTYPEGVNGTALTAAYNHGLWRWPDDPVAIAGDQAELTEAGL